ncbi:MAG: hypothetical protein ACI4NJ_02450 [Cellvibrio sp.]
MSGHYTITPTVDYIHVTAEGTGTFALAQQMWREIAKICNQYRCYKILGEQKLDAPISFEDAFHHFEIFAEAGITSRHQIAWVDRNHATRKVAAFIGNVVSSRLFVRGKIFTEVNDAADWLRSL